MRKSEREINDWRFEFNCGDTDSADFCDKSFQNAGHTHSPSVNTFFHARFVPFGTFRIW